MVDNWNIEDLLLPSDGQSVIASDAHWLYTLIMLLTYSLGLDMEALERYNFMY